MSTKYGHIGGGRLVFSLGSCWKCCTRLIGWGILLNEWWALKLDSPDLMSKGREFRTGKVDSPWEGRMK